MVPRRREETERVPAVLQPPVHPIFSFNLLFLLNDPPRMAKDRKEITRRILDFTLEIIYLLTGEDYTIVKKTSGDGVTPIIHLQESGGWSRSHFSITEPPSPIHEQKILELTNKMMELLTGEVPIRCQDVAVYFTMEEWEYIGGHQDLYEDVMMKDPQLPSPVKRVVQEIKRTDDCFPYVSADGASRRNPPESCPSLLYSQDCLKEDPDVPENHQAENLIDIKVEVVDEEKMNIRADQKDGASRRNPPEICPSPLYSQDCPEEDPDVPENHQVDDKEEDVTNIKVKVEEEWLMDDYPCMRDVKQEIPVDIAAGFACQNTYLEGEPDHLTSPPPGPGGTTLVMMISPLPVLAIPPSFVLSANLISFSSIPPSQIIYTNVDQHWA
ncbi:uncharacterized protein [Eleutherodactylus coqui]|uniref:uncharacterized protein n=1 Tax=Eleutherodactylus coqui TaxID=57060 RepID=UPI003462773B